MALGAGPFRPRSCLSGILFWVLPAHLPRKSRRFRLPGDRRGLRHQIDRPSRKSATLAPQPEMHQWEYQKHSGPRRNQEKKANWRVAISGGFGQTFCRLKLTGLTVLLPPSRSGAVGLPQLVADLEQSNDAYITAAQEIFQKATFQETDEAEFRHHLGDIRNILAEELPRSPISSLPGR